MGALFYLNFIFWQRFGNKIGFVCLPSLYITRSTSKAYYSIFNQFMINTVGAFTSLFTSELSTRFEIRILAHLSQ